MVDESRAGTALRARLAVAGLLGCVVVAGVAIAAGPWITASALYPWKAVTLFAAMVAASLAIVDEHPFPRLGPANRVTLIRAMLVALTAGLIAEPVSWGTAASAVTMASAVAFLDGVDGRLARRSRMASRFGARVDMETDALLIMALSTLVWLHGKAGVWVLACGIMRYAFGAARWPLPWMAGPLTPTPRGKAVAAAQFIGLSIALLPAVPRPFSMAIAAVTLILLTWSFAVDVRRLWTQRLM